ncbi:MAG TPA: hypothetical protein VEM14_05505, partial [Gemmatimonadaceae bacterium]|nr:hypothetical protein [Gemmatimonadaceae bacterium]
MAHVRHAATITWKGRMMNVVAETPAWTATPPRRPLRTPVLFGLAAATGIVDAVCYLGLGHVFTA